MPLTAPANTPTLFVFDDIAFGKDTIAGFDPVRDTIQIAHARVPDLATLQSKTAAFGTGTLITLNPTQSIELTNLAPTALTLAANFRIA